MEQLPQLETNRLRLRAYEPSDAQALVDFANHKKVAETTAAIPYPYTIEFAKEWISSQVGCTEEGILLTWASVLKTESRIIGTVSLEIDHYNKSADLGFWFGPMYWNKGYATEAAKKVLHYAFNTLCLHRIQGYCMSRNTASIKVLEKIGMSFEGIRTQAMLKWGKFEDLSYYAILNPKSSTTLI